MSRVTLPPKPDQLMPSPVDLHQALRSRDANSIEQLLSSGIDVNIPLRGMTPLSLAIYTASGTNSKFAKHNETTTELLLTHGANVNQMSRDHLDRLEPPIYTACRLGQDKLVRLLIKFNADVNKCDWYGQTPLWVAVRERRLDLVQLLLDSDAKLGHLTSWDECPLFLATKYLNFGRREIAFLLTSSGCEADFRDIQERNSLFWALKHGDKELVFLLVMAGARPSVRWDLEALKGEKCQDSEFWAWVDKEKNTPPELKRLCRVCVRRRIVRMNDGVVQKGIEKLPVPKSIKDYLNLL